MDRRDNLKRLKPALAGLAAGLLLLSGNAVWPWANRSAVVAAEPKDDEASRALEEGKAALEAHRSEKAIERCTKAIELCPDCAEAYVCRAQTEGNKCDLDKAIADCTKAIELRHNYFDAYRLRGRAYLDKSQYDKAIVDLSEAIRINPNDAMSYTGRGDAYNNSRDFIKAIADYSESIRLDPKNAITYGCRGSACGMIGEFDKASQDFKRAIEIAPRDWNVRSNFGVFLWQRAQRQDFQAEKAEVAGDANAAKKCRQESSDLKDQAVAQWLEGLKTNPTDSDILSSLGYAFSEFSGTAQAKGNSEDAEEFLRESEDDLTRAVKLNPLFFRPRNNLGRILLRRSQAYDAKARVAEAKGKTDPSQAEIAGQLKADAKVKRDAAIAQFEKAVELNPALTEAHLNLGEVYLALNDPDKAETHYLAIVRLPPPEPRDMEAIGNVSQSHFGLARVAMVRKKTDEAIKQLRESLTLNSRNTTALQLLAEIEFDQSDSREGEQYLRTWLASVPPQRRRTIAQGLGEKFKAEGKTKAAIAVWNSAAWILAASPDTKMRDPQSAVALGRLALHASEKDPLAADTMAAALAADGEFKDAAQTAEIARDLAQAQGKKPLAEAISRRLELYRKGQAYTGER